MQSIFRFYFDNEILTLIQSKFYFSTAVTKRYQCIQQDIRKIVRNSLCNVLSRVRRSEKNSQAAEEESYPREIKFENESNED